jgi:hypothetical protein
LISLEMQMDSRFRGHDVGECGVCMHRRVLLAKAAHKKTGLLAQAGAVTASLPLLLPSEIVRALRA